MTRIIIVNRLGEASLAQEPTEQHRARMLRKFKAEHVRPLLVTLQGIPDGWTPQSGNAAPAGHVGRMVQ